jgi:hypothetical protein
MYSYFEWFIGYFEWFIGCTCFYSGPDGRIEPVDKTLSLKRLPSRVFVIACKGKFT